MKPKGTEEAGADRRAAPFSPYFIVSLIFLAFGCALAWLVLVLATQPPTIKREPLTFAEVVGPQHCRGADQPWPCMTFEGAGE